MAKTLWSFGHSEYNRVNEVYKTSWLIYFKHFFLHFIFSKWVVMALWDQDYEKTTVGCAAGTMTPVGLLLGSTPEHITDMAINKLHRSQKEPAISMLQSWPGVGII